VGANGKAHFGAFAGQDAFSGVDAEVLDASDLESMKRHCTEKGYGGFCVKDGLAHFRAESAEECVRKLVDQEGATFYVSPHTFGRSLTGLKVLTYNLFWWNLYGQRGGNGGSASWLIKGAAPDLMGFQECDDVTRVLRDGGMESQYGWVQGPHSIAIAYLAADWVKLAEGAVDVAVDEAAQFYGSRAVQWVRLQHWRTGRVIFFMNHHGPLRVNSGGRDGGYSTAMHILNEMQAHKQPADALILVGDFNATPTSETIRSLETVYTRAFTGRSFGGVDHFFSTLQATSTQNYGGGGSDHDALSTTFVL